jgi:hypothetical protein
MAGSLQVLAGLKAPVDAFFDGVMVNADDPALRANRLALLGTLHASMNRVADLALFLLPAQLDEGKAHLTIGFGCTGGQHRSVAVAEKLGNVLAKAGWLVARRHRELERRSQGAPVPGAG